MIPVQYFFVLSALLFFIGVYGFCTRRNLVAMLISIELVLNAADLNFAVFNRILFPGQLEGFFFTLFSIGVAAAETASSRARFRRGLSATCPSRCLECSPFRSSRP